MAVVIDATFPSISTRLYLVHSIYACYNSVRNSLFSKFLIDWTREIGSVVRKWALRKKSIVSCPDGTRLRYQVDCS